MTLELAREVAARVGALDGVVAVALGGSLARGRGDADSDVDLGIYYDPARPFSVEALRALVTELDDRHAPELVGFGEWGPWINGGAWTRMRGTKLDLLYRDLGLVDRVLDDCAAGRVTCDYQAGHPHGFHNHMYAGEVHHGLALHDPDGALAERKARTSSYPPALGRAIVRRYSWEADFAVQTATGAARRGDLAYVSGCLFRAVACLVQVLFAVNGHWFVNEKGAVAAAAGLPRTPPGFAAAVEAALSGLGPNPAALGVALERMAALTARVGGGIGSADTGQPSQAGSARPPGK